MATSTDLIVDIDRVTGEYISGWPRVVQSVTTILTTRLRTRLMRLWWGSDFIDTMDKPMVQQVFALSILSAIRYVDMYEPEFDVKQVAMSPQDDGSCMCVITGIFMPDQSTQRVSVPIYSSS